MLSNPNIFSKINRYIWARRFFAADNEFYFIHFSCNKKSKHCISCDPFFKVFDCLTCVLTCLILLHCIRWERMHEIMVQRATCLSWIEWHHQNLENALKSTRMPCQWCWWNHSFESSSSYLQFFTACCSYHQLLVSRSVPWLHCPTLPLELLTSIFLFYFVYWINLVYWVAKCVSAQGKQQGVGVSNQQGRKGTEWIPFHHQQGVFVSRRVGAVFWSAYQVLFFNICPLWSYHSWTTAARNRYVLFFL